MADLETAAKTKSTFAEGAAAGTPPAGQVAIYAKADGFMYSKDDAGAETAMSAAAAGSVATDAIWDAAGDLAVGTGANTAAKLAIGAAGGALSRINGAVAWNSVTSNPGSAVAGDRAWRMDLGLEIYYDGTRWLTTTLYEGLLPHTGISVLPMSSDGTWSRFPLLRTTFDLYLLSFYVTYFVTTTNDGSNFWTIDLGWLTAANSNTNLASITTAAESPSTWTNEVAAINAAINSLARGIRADITKTGAPGTIHLSGRMTYRLIVT